MATASNASSATFRVSNTNDAGPRSLREAILGARSSPGADAIRIAARGAVDLKSPLPDLNSDLRIVGPGADRFRVQRASNGEYRIFTVDDADVSVSGLTVAQGRSDLGGGVAVFGGGSLTLRAVTVRGNTAVDGNDQGGDVYGGGIFNRGRLLVKNSAVTGNVAHTCLAAGCIEDFPFGGGVHNEGGRVDLSNATVSGNSLRQVSGFDYGAGISNRDGLVSLKSVTVTGNHGSANLSAVYGPQGGEMTLRNSIVSDPKGKFSQNCQIDGGSHIVSRGHNLEDSATCNLSRESDKVVLNARLKPLGDNGGQTRTHALMRMSRAIDGGSSSGLETDQRGSARPVDFLADRNGPAGDGSDIGAYELGAGRCSGREVTTVGTGDRNTIRGTRGGDVVAAFGGNDRVAGRDGRDVICGGRGRDRLWGGVGRDGLKGGSSADRLRGGSERDRCNGGPGRDVERSCER